MHKYATIASALQENGLKVYHIMGHYECIDEYIVGEDDAYILTEDGSYVYNDERYVEIIKDKHDLVSFLSGWLVLDDYETSKLEKDEGYEDLDKVAEEIFPLVVW